MVVSSDHGEPGSGPIPLLNEYKHGLLRRRLLQTLTGGLKIRRAPWYIHLIQFVLWMAPLLFCSPFIVLEALQIWNDYYLALVYGCVMGIYAVVLEVITVCVRHLNLPVEVSNQALDDEASIDLTSCVEYLEFIFGKKKRHSLFLHPVASGMLSFAGCLLLFPQVMLGVMHIAGVVVVFIVGWLVLCSSHYSLVIMAPHEPATYRPTDHLDLKYLNRPFYVLAVAAFFIAIRALVVQPQLYLQLLYAVLCLLPLGWTIGVLPPLDALMPWILEYTLVNIMGGSHMATDLRLFISFLLSFSSVAIVSAVPSRTLAVLLATAFGYLLSQDLFTAANALLCLIASSNKRCSRFLYSFCQRFYSTTFASYSSLDFQRVTAPKSILVHYGVCAIKGTLLLGIALVIEYFTFTLNSGDSETLTTMIVAWFIVGLYIFLLASDALQQIYILGIFRNPLHPTDCDNVVKFKRKRKMLAYFSIPRRLIIIYVLPLLFLIFVGLALETSVTVIPHVWFGIATARVLRKIWQHSTSAHSELTLVAILYLALPTSSTWSALGLGSQAVIIGLGVRILKEFLDKLSFASKLFLSFLYDRKQRTYLPLSIVIVTSTVLFLPIVLSIILLSAVISAPLMPLFTLPILFISFPRTKRFWPSLIDYGSAHSSSVDAIYYQQANSELARVLTQSISSGGASAASPGNYFLLRFQDRLAVAAILEHGYGFCTLNIRGLELQETSCHTIEATRIDDIFESIYASKSWLNKHFFNTFQPVDSAVIKVYSDAHNVLTGIIDQPETLQHFSLNFLKTLVWVFLQPFQQEFSKPWAQSQTAIGTDNADQVNCDSGFAGSILAHEQHAKKSEEVQVVEIESDDLNGCDPPDKTVDRQSWSDSVSSLGELSPAHPNVCSIPDHNPLSPDSSFCLPGLLPQDRPLEAPNRMLCPVFTDTVLDTNVVQSETYQSSIPVSANSAPIHPQHHRLIKVHPEEIFGNSTAGKSPKWSNLPIKSHHLDELLKEFPAEWLSYISNTSPRLDTSLEEHFMKVVMTCYSLVDVPCSTRHSGHEEQTKPFDVFSGFSGRFNYSPGLAWLTEDDTLHSLVLKAYRYAVKLMYDEASLGECENSSELVDYLQQYDQEQFIGPENESGWKESVLAETPTLFSLGRNIEENVYTAHVLSLQEEIVHIGQLNQEAVRGIWADLSFELFYLTNDDEERYSIQAHPTLLRNLTIQAADLPLGYHIYSSGIVKVPCIH